MTLLIDAKQAADVEDQQVRMRGLRIYQFAGF
jgi:hypothetical protein